MKNTQIDMERIREALSILKPDKQLVEIRILKGKKIISGYFTDCDTLEKQFDKVDLRDANVFYSLNYINPECYARKQRDKFLEEKITTSDTDIIGYQWLLVDLDPNRTTGISSTKEELIYSHDKGTKIASYLRDLGFPAPIMALSGNGIHLLYRVGLKNGPEQKELIQKCLNALDFLFSDEKASVDTSVFNPSRVSKLYGTVAQKGSDTPDRPHRMSRIISRPQEITAVPMDILKKLAAECPAPQPKKTTASVQNDSFDIESWMNEYGIRAKSVSRWKDSTRYVLEECPFDNSHKAPDSVIIKMDSGAIAFKCFHNSCQGHDWHELRLKFEPDAYDDKRAEAEARIEAGWKAYKQYNRQRDDITYQVKPPAERTEALFETVEQILSKPKEERVCIPTGLIEMDKRIGGLAKGEISLVSGLRGSAKSTWLSQMVLDAIDRGFNTLFYSGELTDRRFIKWMMQQAAGKDNVLKSKNYDNLWFAKKEAEQKISKWIGNKFLLYDNAYGNNFVNIASNLRDAIRAYKSDLVIIDNMSILDLSDITEDRRADKWDKQKMFVELLKNLSAQCNCHIAFVAHPRKALGFLRLDDVGGSGALGNLVDNAFIMHRINNDFRKGYKAYFGREWVKGGTNCIEIVKERESGIQDFFIPLWHEKETRRMKNSEDEYKVYGWDIDGFLGIQMDFDDLPFNDDGSVKK